MDGFKKVGDDLDRIIESDTTSTITTDSEDNKPALTCREKLRYIIHGNKFQITIIILVIIDCLLVISELLIDLGVFDHQIRSGGGEGEEGGGTSVTKRHPTVSVVAEVLHFLSIAILSLFMIEIIVKVYAMGLDFFKHKMEVFDAVVVIVSFALDIAFIGNEAVSGGIGLLILLRLWRVTRILNGIILSVKTQAEKRLNREKQAREAVEQELAKFRTYCSEQELEIETLQNLLTKHKINFKKSERLPISKTTLNVIAEVNEIKEPNVNNESSGNTNVTQQNNSVTSENVPVTKPAVESEA
ncbi:unnamed protein product [Owenia fusiformis]|uniref:Voltage-gated hydrogen channel 1 n=1 Tax=Owenia fusiformis TaxID=6347 RepID=A0A8J1UWN1_OWEFU|nr:unnamed protein product [Owenia fusiformis]